MGTGSNAAAEPRAARRRTGLTVVGRQSRLMLIAARLRDLLDEPRRDRLLAAWGPAPTHVTLGSTRLDLSRPEHLAMWRMIPGCLLRKQAGAHATAPSPDRAAAASCAMTGQAPAAAAAGSYAAEVAREQILAS